MAKKILISLANRNLLIFSDVLQSIEPDLYCFLERNERVYPNMIEDPLLIDKIQN